MGKKKNHGKSPKGRAGAKKKAQKGGTDGGWVSNFVRNSDFSRQMLDEDYDEPQKLFRGFAQSSGSQRNLPPRNPALRFRHQPITFVSAGSNTPVETELDNKLKLSEEAIFVAAEDSEEEDDGSESEFDDSNIQTNIFAGTDVRISEGFKTLTTRDQGERDPDVDMVGVDEDTRATSPEVYPFVVDTVGDPSLVSGFRINGMQSVNRDPSPARSDSSEEVVLFHGRNNANAVHSSKGAATNQSASRQKPQTTKATPASDSNNATAGNTANQRTAFNDASHTQSGGPSTYQQRPRAHHDFANDQTRPAAASWKPVAAEAKGWATSASKADAEVNPEAIWAPAPSQPFWKKGKSRKSRPDLNLSPPRQSKVALGPPQTDGSADDAMDSDTWKKIERLAKITRVQAKDDAAPPTSSKKVAKMETRIGNIAMLESELSPQHVQLARRMGAEEAVRLEQAARSRQKGSSGQEKITFVTASSSTVGETRELGETLERPGDGLVIPSQSEENDAAETIASLQAEVKEVLRGKGKARESLRELNGDKVLLQSPKPKRRGKRGRRKDNRQLRDPIISDDENSGEEAAYDDYLANLEAQLDENTSSIEESRTLLAMGFNHSATISGPSLVVDGKEIGDDEVLQHGDDSDWEDEEEDYADGMNGDDTSSESTGPIGQDRINLSDMDSSDLEDKLEYTEQEQWEDEEDLRERRKAAMTDEQVARIFAKQEELGIHGDDMIIENGEYGDISDGIGDVATARAGLANIGLFSLGRPSNKHGMRRRSNRGNFDFPDASALADTVEQYGENGFDIMDFDRPSLRPRKKGRKGTLPPELEALSDEELKRDMIDTWDNDRAKKRLKKAEREELRAQGMLGATGKKGKADLSQKYQFGMSSKQVHDELRIFLQDDGQTSRPFPPMNKFDRKELHELANALNLKSKSVGMGKDRFPVLFKTSRTPVYNPEVFDKAVSASVNGWLDSDRKYGKKLAQKAAKAPKRGKGRDSGRVADATVRNGEVVGAGAAEIGKENFGHKLMEKMGWSKGMALGKEGEGILLPVEQVMRAGRGGLG